MVYTLSSYTGYLYGRYYMVYTRWCRVYGIIYIYVYGMWYILLEVQGSYDHAIAVVINH